MKKDIITLAIAVIITSFVPLFPRFIDLNATTIVFIRALIAGLVTFLFWKIKGLDNLKPVKRDAIKLIGIGLIMGLHWITYFQAIQVSGVAVGMISFFTFPILIVLIGPIFGSAKWQFGDLILAFLVFAGIIIMALEFDLENNLIQGIFWGLLSAVFFSFRTILSKPFVQQYDGVTVMVYQFPAAALATLPFLLAAPERITGNDWILLIILGVFFTAVGHILLVMSLDTLKPATYGIMSASTPFLGILLAILFLREIPDFRTFIGGGIILGTAFYEAWRTLKQSD